MAPLVERAGVRNLSMRAAARAAGLSVSGLYHYFPSKRDLVLLPIDPEFNARVCEDYHDRMRHLDADAFAAEMLRLMAGSVTAVRPAVRAAMELGTEVFESALASASEIATGGFTRAVRRAAPHLDAPASADLERALLHTFLAAVLDRTATAAQLEADLRLLLLAHRARRRVPSTRPRPAALIGPTSRR
ncbi:TetR/AcrR family transcriptional regulator [Lentzea sp. NPDC060358]|uniref:TetR/AcrR family transcriptional regulator n=1 Tax=Lentzea sp. NPDC060358 TaxID=3347103 RepID=UPI0036550C38